MREDKAGQRIFQLMNQRGMTLYDKLEKAGAVRMEIKDSSKNVIANGEVGSDVRSQVKEKAVALNPQKKKKLKERIAEKREKINKDDKDKNRERTKNKKREQSL